MKIFIKIIYEKNYKNKINLFISIILKKKIIFVDWVKDIYEKDYENKIDTVTFYLWFTVTFAVFFYVPYY